MFCYSVRQAEGAKEFRRCHILVDAVNLKWTAVEKGVNAFAFVSKDADFKVVVDDIRASTAFDVFVFVPTSEPNVLADYLQNASKVFRYGSLPQARPNALSIKQEEILCDAFIKLGYITNHQELKKRQVHHDHLELFCHVNKIPFAKAGWKRWRMEQARLALAAVESGQHLLCKPEGMVHIHYIKSATGTFIKSRQFLIIDAQSMPEQELVETILHVLGFLEAGAKFNGGVFALFLERQSMNHWSAGRLDDAVINLGLDEQLSYMHYLFVDEDFAGMPWLRAHRSMCT